VTCALGEVDTPAVGTPAIVELLGTSGLMEVDRWPWLH